MIKTPSSKRENSPPFETMLPSVHEEFKQLELKSVTSDVVKSNAKGSIKSASKSRKSNIKANEASQELKSKVSKMMSNHS